jgi:hypothetical protein
MRLKKTEEAWKTRFVFTFVDG